MNASVRKWMLSTMACAIARRKPARHASAFVAAVAIMLAFAPGSARAAVLGFLGNFDVTNDTGKPCYGFEIDLEGIHMDDVTDVFGGPGRGFPTGRGFDPNTAVERYGAPTITEYNNGGVFGTKVVYSAIYDNATMTFDYNTPSGNVVTPGDNCWTGGGIGYGPGTSCDHFGVGTRINPTNTTYSWLQETSPGSGVLTSASGVVQLPAPKWEVVPDPVQPQAPPMVIARIEAPEPDAFDFGDALWVKVFTTEVEHEVELEDLVGNGPLAQDAQTEIEWQLLQKEKGNPDSGMLEGGNVNPVGGNAESVFRRYEFYAFSGTYGSDHEARFDPGFGDSNPGPGDVGAYLGSQNAAANLVPEPLAVVLLLTALIGLSGPLYRRGHA